MTSQNSLTAPLPSARTGALYNAFSYPTKISPESIAVLLAAQTAPGAVVLDTFAGSGTTGLAALLCDRPTPRMHALAAELGLTPRWGPRHAVLYELGTLGAFVSRVLCAPPEPTEFQRAARAVHAAAAARLQKLYATHGPDGEAGHVRHIIWSEVLECPACQHHVSFWDAVVRHDPLRFEDQFECASCHVRVAAESAQRVVEQYDDPRLGRAAERRVRVPIRVYGQSGRKKWMRPALPGDAFADDAGAADWAPTDQMHWGDLFRSGYHRGITHVHQFYTARNLAALAALWAETASYSPRMRDALRLWILSYNSTHSTLMTRVVVKKNQKDFILTGAQSGVLYVSGLPVEKNVFEGVLRKIKTFTEAFAQVHGSGSTVCVVNASSTALSLPDGSADYVFTDPPFGDYIPYAELNQLNEAWLGERTDRAEEVIVSPAQGKDVSAYGALMQAVFREIARVLSPAGCAAVVFHSSRAAVWRELVSAYENAGLSVHTSSILDKSQPSFKQVVSPGSVMGDPLIVLVPNGNPAGPGAEAGPIADEMFARATDPRTEVQERTPERLYSRYVTRCLESGVDVQLDAPDFYKRVRAAGVR